MSDDKKKKLLDFIDKKAFDVVINADPGKYSKEDQKKLEDIQRKTKNEKDQFHFSAIEHWNNYLFFY